MNNCPFLPAQKAANNGQRIAESASAALVRAMARATPGRKLPFAEAK